jgi:hypothetical protein
MCIPTFASTWFVMVSGSATFRKTNYLGYLKSNKTSTLDGLLDWREIQTLVRSMPDLHKTLILANVKSDASGNRIVEELAIATEHAPFRHKVKVEVGSQRKKAKVIEN